MKKISCIVADLVALNTKYGNANDSSWVIVGEQHPLWQKLVNQGFKVEEADETDKAMFEKGNAYTFDDVADE